MEDSVYPIKKQKAMLWGVSQFQGEDRANDESIWAKFISENCWEDKHLEKFSWVINITYGDTF